MLHRRIAARKQSAAPSDLHAHGRLVERFNVQRAFLVSAARKLAMHSPPKRDTRRCALDPGFSEPGGRAAAGNRAAPAAASRRSRARRGPRSCERSRFASPPSASIANAHLPSPAAAFPRSCVRDMFSPCAPTLSHPTPTSSSGSAVDAARERAPIASPGSPPNTARKSR